MEQATDLHKMELEMDLPKIIKNEQVVSIESLCQIPSSQPMIEAMGKCPPVAVVWKDINATVTVGDTGEDKTILHGISGEVPQGEMCALMGPTGCGE